MEKGSKWFVFLTKKLESLLILMSGEVVVSTKSKNKNLNLNGRPLEIAQ